MKLKTNINKLRKRYLKSRSSVAILSICILAVALATYGVANYYVGRAQEVKRFEETSTAKDQIVRQLAAVLGEKVMAVHERSECFQAGQGPFDDGHLWCQAASAIKLNASVEYLQVGTAFMEVGRMYGLEAKTEIGLSYDDYNVLLKTDVNCRLFYRNSSGMNLGNIKHLPVARGERDVIIVACASQAESKHYPFFDKFDGVR